MRCACPTKRSPTKSSTRATASSTGTSRRQRRRPIRSRSSSDLAAFVNLRRRLRARIAADEANARPGLGLDPAGDPDPLITSPLYGRWHALTQRLLVDRDGTPLDPDDNWVHELNLDPRYRVAAGFGTRVVQSNQESYMDAAWEQVGDVLEANRRIRLAQLAKLVSQSWWFAQLTPSVETRPERLLRLTAPAHRHVLLADNQVTTTTAYQTAPGVAAPSSGAATLRHRFATSLAGTTLLSAPLRRVTRPGARLARKLPFGGGVSLGTLLERVDAGEVSAAPPKVTPPGVVTTDEVADTVVVPPLPSWVPDPIAEWLLDLLRRWRWLPWLLLALAGVFVVVGSLLILCRGRRRVRDRRRRRLRGARAVRVVVGIEAQRGRPRPRGLDPPWWTHGRRRRPAAGRPGLRDLRARRHPAHGAARRNRRLAHGRALQGRAAGLGTAVRRERAGRRGSRACAVRRRRARLACTGHGRCRRARRDDPSASSPASRFRRGSWSTWSRTSAR